jgi:ABC-2 type transport system ATP-binding protein
MSVECFGLTKRYGHKVALDDVSLEINDGGVTGLVGANGAGKSTLIKLITGLIWPTAGFVLIDGFDAHREHSRAMRRIGAIIE